ncbi:C-type lectin domain family 11 member A [Elysia marginata]|uniref:C-type lectin domain family 11 member A n=1 Tax=Elysia marginata TaxID=1093978 RepID=A0AAV4GUY0_9GAST|nr:C-type lectin domain family 11 member A [Elysia marginata]
MVPLIFGIALLIFASPAFCANRTVENSCPSNQVRDVGKRNFAILGNTCYMFYRKDRVNYEIARQRCQKDNGDLAMPKTKDINDFLLKEMKRINQFSAMWIGMNDLDTEGKYYWEDGTKVRAWGNMAIGRLIGGFFSGQREDCIALDPGDGKWHDYRCPSQWSLRDHTLDYICQYPI